MTEHEKKCIAPESGSPPTLTPGILAATQRVLQAEENAKRGASPQETPAQTTATPTENRFSHWATDLLVTSLRGAALGKSDGEKQLIHASADRLDALYHSYERQTSDDRDLLDREYSLHHPASGATMHLTGRAFLANLRAAEKINA